MLEKIKENHITSVEFTGDYGVINVAYFHHNGEKPVAITPLQIANIQRHALENQAKIKIGTDRGLVSSILNKLGVPELISDHMTSRIPENLEISEPFGALVDGKSLTVVVAGPQILLSRNST